MPRYFQIPSWKNDDDRNRTLDRLLALRTQLKKEVAKHKSESSLLLGTWNLREFDSNAKKHGHRLAESMHYIAEIVAGFDLVAIQEIHRDLKGLHTLMELLGDDWDYIVTDTTEGKSGNNERVGFVYDKRKVAFRNVAGEIVLPKGKRIVVKKEIKTEDGAGNETVAVEEDALQFARTPFMVAFQSGWFKFNLCSLHIYFGAASGDKLKRRTDEIAQLAKFFADRQEKSGENYILLGDFNIVSPEHKTMEALKKAKFKIPTNLLKEKTNLKGDKHYDQIALKVEDKRLAIGASGVFDFTHSVFGKKDFLTYYDKMPPAKRDFLDSKKTKARSFKQKQDYYMTHWRTFQMSDHLPMWAELKVDFTDDYLKSLKTGQTPLAD